MTRLDTLLPVLERLDARLRAVAEGTPPDGPILAVDPGSESPLTALGHALGLDAFALDVLLLALAPEVDEAYGAYFAALQEDATARRPTLGSALRLLCTTPRERLERRTDLGPGAPLFQWELLRLAGADTTRPAAALAIDEHVVDWLLGERGIDPRLESAATLVTPRPELDPGQALPALLAQLETPSVMLLAGPREAGALDTAEALAQSGGRRLLVLSASDAAGLGIEPGRCARLAARDAALHDAVVCLIDIDDVEPALIRRLVAGLRAPALAIGTSARALDGVVGAHVLVAPLEPVDTNARRAAWRRALGDTPTGADLDALASRFRLEPSRIDLAARDAADRALRRAAAGGDGQLVEADLFAGARARSGRRLARLTRLLEPVFGWDDIVLPDDSRSQLEEICARVRQRDRVIEEWGFRRALGTSPGVGVLFAGSSGTGKTMAAGILAKELGVDLYAIDLAGIVSKYIGETSKNLDRIFEAAEDANAILFFDEADALFGKRSEVRDAHDRYANTEVAYLLQRMEAYDGLAILATNLRQSLDEAFARRLSFTVHFPFPGAEERLDIWQRIWPEEVRLARDVDLVDLADRFRLSGGNIRNAALAAAFLAAEDGTRITRAHLLRAVRREYQKLGKGLASEELEGVPVGAGA